MTFAAKSITGALAAVLLTTAVASPAEARRRGYGHDRRGGISLGDVVLGTIAIAGVATVAGALSDGRRSDRRYDDRRYGRSNDYGRYDGGRYDGGSQASVEACAYEAEREVGQRFGGRAQVREIDGVTRDRDGYRVRGTIEVRSDGSYDGSGYGRDRYARDDQRVQFTCSARGDRVVDLNVGSYYAQGY